MERHDGIPSSTGFFSESMQNQQRCTLAPWQLSSDLIPTPTKSIRQQLMKELETCFSSLISNQFRPRLRDFTSSKLESIYEKMVNDNNWSKGKNILFFKNHFDDKIF
jgi:hypothetical protein